MPITPDQAHNTRRHLGAAGGAAFVQSGNAGANNPGEAYAVGASEYGGPGDPSTPGHMGAYGNLEGTMGYAELDMGSALGGLPPHTELIITYQGQSVIGTKLDIGLGGGPVDGHPRCIDLWWETADALGFSGLGVVFIERRDGKPIKGKAGKATQTGNSALSQIAGAPANAVSAAAGAVSSVGDFLGRLGALFFTQAGWVRLLKLFIGVTLGVITLKAILNDVGVHAPSGLPIPV
jgi:hypothetical protein